MEDNEVNMPVKKQPNPMAVASFVLALVGLLIAGLPCGIAALVTGILGLAKFDSEKQNSKWMAIVGIIVGIADAVLVILAVTSIISK